MAGLTDLFTDMVRETSETALGGRNGYENLVQKEHYTSSFLMGGKSAEEYIQTGQTIRDTLYLQSEDVGKRFGGAGLRFDWQNTQIGTKVTAQMSYYANYIAWDELELDLNADSSMGPAYIRSKFSDILKGKFQNLTQTTADQFEAEKWAAADQASMRTDFAAPMSIPYYITEETNGVPLQSDGTALSDVLGLSGGSAGTFPKWDNKRVTYDSYGGAATDGEDLLGSLDYAAMISHFEPLPMKPEHGVMESAPNVVFCSDDGLRKVGAALRAGQDQWGRSEYPGFYGLTLGSMVFRNVTALNDAALYSAGGSLGTEATATLGGPRFWGVSKKALRCLFMRDRYMTPGEVTNLTAVGKPNEYVQVFKTYNQLWCSNRRRLFIVSPSTDLVA